MATPTVLVKRLGSVCYEAALALQYSLVEKYKNARRNEAGELLLCEHSPPVFTFGLREREEFEGKAEHLQQLGAQVFKVRRGGLTTFHGPGQLVCYPVLNLRQINMGVKQYINSLEEAVIQTVTGFGVPAHRSLHTGVWVWDAEGREKKICAIGIQVSKGVAFHGLALNCSTELSWFTHIQPCGVEDKGVTSLSEAVEEEEEGGAAIGPWDVAAVMVESLSQSLGVVCR